MNVKPTKRNNYGKGFWYEFADGSKQWCLCYSRQELKVETGRHGALIRRDPA